MQFTVVIPSYNRAALIGATLCSVLEQTFSDYEVIIVDDGSTDNTREVVVPFLADSRIRYFKIENSERGAARNFGVRHAIGRYITFLDSDDIFLPWHLKTANEKVQMFQSPAAFHLGYEILHLNGEVNALPLLSSPVNDKLLEGNFLSCMGVFLRRDVALENPFDEDRRLSGSEDYELWMRIAARVPILTFPEVTSRLINHENRSVILTNVEQLVTRISFLGKKLQSDKMFIKRFGNQLNVFDSYRTLYLALHLAMSGKRWMALKSLFFTVRTHGYVLFNYRFIVVIKKILLW